jgi:MFS transporter, DHA2 family, multidrug resistance protein
MTVTLYHGDNKLILGIVLAVITFWLFAQTTLSVAPAMRGDLRLALSVSNIAVSIAALFSGMFIVVAGGLADQFGRVKLTNIGLALSIVGSLLIALSPVGTATFLMTGRVIQGISAACIMPATLALMKAYFDGRDRQRALSFWSIGSWGGSGLSALFGGFVASTLGWRWIFWMSSAVAITSGLYPLKQYWYAVAPYGADVDARRASRTRTACPQSQNSCGGRAARTSHSAAR